MTADFGVLSPWIATWRMASEGSTAPTRSLRLPPGRRAVSVLFDVQGPRWVARGRIEVEVTVTRGALVTLRLMDWVNPVANVASLHDS